MTTDLDQAIRALDAVIRDPSGGLPEDVFLLVTRLTPMVNVDLLIRDPERGTLLTWREDGYYGTGWHVPGGIIRFKETAARRICETARLELGAEVQCDPAPAAVFEFFDRHRDTRGHFISLLYRCRLRTPPDPERAFVSGRPAAGQWQWHRGCPADILEVHRHYAAYLDPLAP